MFLSIIFIILAVALLFFGAELSLNASEIVGKKLKLSPLVIGMVLIGLGTSLPELFVAHIASIDGKTDLAVGALVGSNIANMLLILPLSAMLVRLSLRNKNLRGQLFVHFILGIALVFLFKRGIFDYISGIVLSFICMLYIALIFRDIKSYEPETPDVNSNGIFVFFKLIIGFTMLYGGGELLVKGGVSLCQEIGVSEYIISSIFIAFGTSFPELVTVLMSAYKKKDTDLIVGNIIGSNLFNCSLILGSISFYKFNFESEFIFESLALVFGSSYLLFVSVIKRDFFRLSAVIFLIMYTLVVLSWTGIIDRSDLWI